jgi:hypothetical protein
VARYFTHIYETEVLHDEHGQEFANLDAAMEGARRAASELIAESIAQGITVELAHRLEVVEEGGQVVIVLPFEQLFKGNGTAPDI